MRLGRGFVRVLRCGECGGVLWPWQDVVQRDDWEYILDHHRCHHVHMRFVWDEEWRDNIACECVAKGAA